jgi:hypothetical protein
MAIIDERMFDVDRHGLTRLPGPIVLGLVFLCRYLILVVIVFASARRSPDVTRVLGNGFEWWFLALEIPAAALLLAYGTRSPGAAQWVRQLWTRGPLLIYGAVLAHLVAAVALLVQSKSWQPWPELFLVSCSLIDCALAWRVWSDPFFKHVFAEFPKDKAEPSKDAAE